MKRLIIHTVLAIATLPGIAAETPANTPATSARPNILQMNPTDTLPFRRLFLSRILQPFSGTFLALFICASLLTAAENPTDDEGHAPGALQNEQILLLMTAAGRHRVFHR